MAGFIFKKKSRGCNYYYAAENERKNGKMQRKWEVYLGPLKKIVKTMEEGILLLDEVNATPYGLYSAFVATAKEIDFIENFNNVYPKRDQGLSIGEYFLLGMLARLTETRTKNSIKEWYDDHRLDMIYPVESKHLTAQNIWNNLSSLDFEMLNEVHHLLRSDISKKYDIHDSYIYFDPSNFYTFIEESNETNEIAKRGKNKHNRNDLRQVNLALAVTQREGIPVYHKTYPGNVNDVTFFKENIEEFTRHLKRNGSQEITIVFDKGNNAQEIFDTICQPKDESMQFIGSLRPSSHKDLFRTPVEDFPDHYVTDADNTVLYKEIEVEEYGRSFRGVLTYDSKTFRKKMFTWTENMKMITDDVEEFVRSKLNVKKWRQKEAVEQKLKTLVSRKGMKDIISFEVSGDYGKLSVSLSCDINEAENAMGPWGKTLIFTSCKDKNIVDVIKGYRMKNDVEDCFKMLNNSQILSIRPFHHWTDQMIKAHMAICVLGLELIQVMKKKLKDQRIEMSCEKMLKDLHSISLVELKYTKKKTTYKVGSKKKIRKMAQILDVEFNPCGSY